MRIAKKGAAALAAALLVLSILCLLALGIGPRTGAYRTLTMLTGSMTPDIPPGSLVIVTPIRARDLRAGDVITYNVPLADHRVVTHRVVEIVEGGTHPVVRTKGDANLAADPWTARIEGSRVWRVRTAIPKLGRTIAWLRKPGSRRAGVLVVPALLAFLWIGEIWRRPGHRGLPAHV